MESLDLKKASFKDLENFISYLSYEHQNIILETGKEGVLILEDFFPSHVKNPFTNFFKTGKNSLKIDIANGRTITLEVNFNILEPILFLKKETLKLNNMENLNFGQAIEALKQGKRVARQGWNGKGMFAYYVDGSEFMVNRPPLNKIFEENTKVSYRPHIDLKAADGTCGVWNPNMMDILAEDWLILD